MINVAFDISYVKMVIEALLVLGNIKFNLSVLVTNNLSQLICWYIVLSTAVAILQRLICI